MTASVEEWKRRYETARLAHEEARAEIERLNDARGEQDLEINKLRGEIERLRALVKDLADDLASELRGRYWSPDGTVHPAEQRRFERDMSNVYAARRALEPKP